ncbi:polymorphic toxin-type HINT domain-containing protein [Bythopirellula polymerisocia]|uniref:Hint domain-containing protein n=1 Tax=Bythopirellula polymerisocia TaxID=2528003 RepID=A0A5C6CXS6_9BACT|nr:polymorphic toxin-type HINT domain-containing protein [Bythopirellula polymerisocia]TWU29248.1 hypothetical protein Pla144_00240 [Bythopirellula polymerisocia]
MKLLSSVSFVIALFAVVLSSSQSPATQVGSSSADTLFRQALAAAARGEATECEQLLAEVLRTDPDYQLARWYSGQVHYDGQWMPINAVGQMVSSDPRWDEYQARKLETGNSPREHASLARWCRTEGLSYEEKWHWLNVLASDPDNREALGRLDLRIYQGQYMSPGQIKEHKLHAENAEDDFKVLTKRYQSWIAKAIRANSDDIEDTVKKVSEINDVAAIPALIEIFFLDMKTDKAVLSKLGDEQGGRLLSDLRLAVVQALTQMEQHEATWALLQIAVEWPDPEASNQAAEALIPREKSSYMPTLMGALSSPLEAAISVRVAPNGQYTVYEDIAESHPLVRNSHFKTSKFLNQHTLTINKTSTVTDYRGMRDWTDRPKVSRQTASVSKTWSERNRDFNNAMAQASGSRERIDLENSLREQRNANILKVLRIVTGEDLGSHPSAWWKDWNIYNELNTPEKLTDYQTYEEQDYSRYSYQNYAQNYSGSVGTPPPRPPTTHSCFVAGTPVWTQSGPVRIETVQVGDLVLSQDPFTGKLDYRPVLETSVGPPSPILNLVIDHETISTTRGHRFWVVDKGWQMSKFLKPGDRLVAQQGWPELLSVEKANESEAFNLVVGQFHTYFVGNQKLLVHDKNCPLPNIAYLPGVEQISVVKPSSLRN